jgi:hypothetical protein
MVTKEQAQAIAAAYLRTRGLAERVREVCDGADGGPRGLYGVPDLATCWIVYLVHPHSGRGLYSSTILLVEKAGGVVVYHGSARDEG